MHVGIAHLRWWENVPSIPGACAPAILCIWQEAHWRDGEVLSESRDHDDVMTWKCLLYYWPFVRGIHLSNVDSPHKGPVMWSFEVLFVVEHTFEQIIKLPVIWNTRIFTWDHYNVFVCSWPQMSQLFSLDIPQWKVISYTILSLASYQVNLSWQKKLEF